MRPNLIREGLATPAPQFYVDRFWKVDWLVWVAKADFQF